jgi:hypothetical protein
MTFHQGPHGIEIELPYGSHLLRVPLQDPILLLVDSAGAIVRRVFAGEPVEIGPEERILSLCPRTTPADRLNAALAMGRTDPLFLGGPHA